MKKNFGLIAIGVFALAAFSFAMMYELGATGAANGRIVPLYRGEVNFRIGKTGTITAAGSIEVPCKLNRGGTITWIVETGRTVKKGDLLFTFDTSAEMLKRENLLADIKIAEADLANLRVNIDARITNTTMLIEKLEAGVKLAESQLEKVVSGADIDPEDILESISQQSLAEIEAEINTIKLDRSIDLEKAGIVSKGSVEEDMADKALSEISIRKARIAIEKLRAGPSEAQRRELELAIDQARFSLKTTRSKLERVLQGRENWLANQRIGIERLKRSLAEVEDEIKNSTVYSPAGGIVRRGEFWGSEIQPGRRVWRRNIVVTIPSRGKFKVAAQLAENEYVRVKEKTPALVRIPSVREKPFAAEITKIAELGQDEFDEIEANTKRIFGSLGRKTYETEITLTETHPRIRLGQAAVIEIIAERRDAAYALSAAVVKDPEKGFYVRRDEGAPAYFPKTIDFEGVHAVFDPSEFEGWKGLWLDYR